MDKLKLFCFPYAGGSAKVFNPWKKYLDDFIELHPIELAGRGSRGNEPFYQSFEEALNDLSEIILNEIDDAPYAFFGHSMGGIITYELSHRIQQMDLNHPTHIYFSGMKAPGTTIRKNAGKITDKWIEEKIIKLGGTPRELMKNKDILKLFMPILRSDFQMLESYQSIKRNKKLTTDITILNGESDDLVTNDIKKWQAITTKKSNIHTFQGGHFFIKHNVKAVTEVINQTLKNYGDLFYSRMNAI